MKIEKIEIPCPVCESNKYAVIFEPWVNIDDPIKLYGATSGIQGTQRLVRCLDCGVIYENPRYPEEVILKGYESYDQQAHDSQHEMRVNSFYRSLVALKKNLPPPIGSKVLDIGTAGGGFLEAASRFGYNAMGIEPSHFMVEQGQKKGLNIIQGILKDDVFPASSFDLICLWDVLEHVTNPLNVLQVARKIVKPGGVLLINYPDIGTRMAKLAGKKFWWILSVHMVHFDRQSINNICNKAGFDVFHYQDYWQTLEFGYLEDMAIHYKIPLSKLLKKMTPGFIQSLHMSYYASQTTVLARPRN